MIGSKLAHYNIQEELGRGGMGVVYKARDTHLDRFVAIKVLPAEAVANAERKRRFVQEAKAASALNHPNIVTIHDIACDNGTDFIAMEYVPGKPLDELIPARGMPLGEVLKLGVQIADALTAAHAAGIVHRDLKPANIIVGDDRRVRVLDFGLAKLTDPSESSELDETKTVAVAESSPPTEEGTILGTASYMSPEQAEGRKVDVRSDIFSFGSVLYEMVTGRRPFVGDSKMSTLAAIINKEPQELPATLPFELRRLIERCLRKDPDRRRQHMDDVRLALQDLKEESESGKLAAVTGVSVEPRKRWPPPTWQVAIIVVAAVAVAAGAWLLTREARDTERSTALLPQPLTTYPGWEQSPSFSPDGERVVFSWSHEGQSDIYVKLIGSEGRQQLTTDPRNDYSPAWSPDGRQIAFTRILSDDEWAVILTPSIGGPERTLLRMPQGEWPRLGPYLSWHPSGEWLVLTGRREREETASLYLVSVRSGEARRLTAPPPKMQGDACAAFSPDGRELVFCRVVQQATSDLHLLTFDTEMEPKGEPVRLTQEETILASPVWLPGSRELALAYGRPPNIALLDLEADARPRPLGIGQRVQALTYSETRNRLVYVVRNVDTNIWSVRLDGPGTVVGAPKKILASTATDIQPDYSPDGSRIAFHSGRSGSAEVWVSNSDGLNPVRLTSLEGAALANPYWSPDGNEILFATVVDENMDIYAISADGGTPRRLTEDPARDIRGMWSRDKRWLYFQSNRTGDFECYRMQGVGGEAVRLTEGGGGHCRISADGRFLYYSRGIPAASVWKMEVERGDETQLVPEISNPNAFAPVPGGVYFLARGEAGGTRVRFLDEATGEVSEVLEVPVVCRWLRASRDGKFLIWSQFDDSGADLMLVENFLR